MHVYGFVCCVACGENYHKGITRNSSSSQTRFFVKLTKLSLQTADCHISSEDRVILIFKYKDEFVSKKMTTNIVLASFITAHARLHLFNVLYRLDESILYFDMDSIIYKSLTREDLIPTGDS